MNFADKQAVKQFIEENDIRDIGALNQFLKSVSGAVIGAMLEAERDEHLGYQKHQKSPSLRENLRNGYSNYEEACASESVRYFVHKLSIVLNLVC